jgi:flagellar hook-associated protein 2
MAGIQLTGLYSGMNWSNVISEIIAADSAPMTNLKAEVTTNQAKITTFKSLQNDVTALQTAVQGLDDSGTNVFDLRTAAMTDSSSSWTPNAGQATPTGSYAIDVTRLATEAQLNGAKGISGPLSSSAEVSGVTLASMNTATPVTAGTFTVDGQEITVSLSESLQDVLTAITNATGNVTAAYNPSSDETNPDTVTLTSSGGALVLGAANDTSNFLQVMGLESNGTTSVTSPSPLGSASLSSPLASAGFANVLTGQDSSGNGSFSINGVTINYNVNTDTLQDVINRINGSSAGVTASFSSQGDQMELVNNVTGNIGITASDNASSGNLLSVLGLADTATLQQGKDAQFTVNGGSQRTASSNNLSSTDLGVAGLSVTVNSETNQTIQVQPDTASMQSAIQGFITAYNQLTSDITTDTAITSSNGAVTTSILSGNFEVSDWGQELQSLAFGAVSGASGAIQRLDQMGIGFTGTTNQLSITDSAQLQSVLSSNPQGVAAFFQAGGTGFVSNMSGYLNGVLAQDISEQKNLVNTNSQLDDQISVLQTYLNNQQTALTAEFTAMESAIQQAQSEQSYLSGLSSSSGSSSSSSGSTISSSAFSSPSSSSGSSSSSSSNSTTG